MPIGTTAVGMLTVAGQLRISLSVVVRDMRSPRLPQHLVPVILDYIFHTPVRLVYGASVTRLQTTTQHGSDCQIYWRSATFPAVPEPSDEWQVALATTVGKRVAKFRKQRGMTAQQLSDQLAEQLGVKMQRTVIGNLEAGERRTVSLAEIFALAYVLRVPAILLQVPLGKDEFEVLPGMTVHPWYAARWVAGEGHLPGDVSDLVRTYRRPDDLLAMYRQHDTELSQWLRAARMSGASGVEAMRAGEELPPAAVAATSRLLEIENRLALLRGSIRAREAVPPPLPPQLQHLDEEGGDEDARGQEDRPE
jgi:transcriptional regulator with XRE-family HTH domain